MVDTIIKGARGIAGRVVKFTDLVPCYDAFIDTRTPGSDKKENFTIIGPGVSENPNQHVHITERHGFNIGGARQPPGCTNSQHSHDTAEVFYVHEGRWRFDLGEHGDEATVTLGPGDLISIPTNVFRGFTNIGKDTGYLWAVLGGNNPGRVLWAPGVFDMATEYGLVLLDDGMLIDTANGETIPAGKNPMPVTTPQQVATLKIFNDAELESCTARAGADGPRGSLSELAGVRETMLIGQGAMDWPHGFHISEMTLAPGAIIPAHIQHVSDVWFIHSGKLTVSIGQDRTILSAGDTVTFPTGSHRSMKNAGDVPVTIVTVRGGDETAAIGWS